MIGAGELLDASTQQELRTALERIPDMPSGWSFFCRLRDLDSGPVTQAFLDRRLVAFRSATGRIAILDARCGHMGADLGRGRVVGETIECPYHGWRYGCDGHCEHIPCSPAAVPPSAHQRAYPAVARNGLLFVYHGADPYDLPFFDGVAPEDFTCSAPLVMDLECPWYMVSANAIDFQHLNSVHDRRLLEPPTMKPRGLFGCEARTLSRVGRTGWYDRAIRAVGGDTAEMTVTLWSGTLVFVRVTLRQTRTYGMVSIRPLGPNRVRAHVFAFIPKSRHAASGAVDPLRAAVRRFFIEHFVRADAQRLNGMRGGRMHLIAADAALCRYLIWLSAVSSGRPHAEVNA